MTPDLEIEKSVVAAFVIPQKRSRYLGLLESRKGRDKFRRGLAHFADWDRRFVRRIKEHTPRAIHDVLRQMGAPADCYVLSENDRNDAKRMGLLEALTDFVGAGIGTVISCVPGRLAFYEGEVKERCALRRDGYSDS